MLLADTSCSATPLIFKSYKSRRVAPSVLAAKIIAFSDIFDDSFALQHQLQQAMQIKIPIHLMTDSKCLFDVVSKGSRTAERRLMIDIASFCEAYQLKEIGNIGFVRSDHNLADGLNKPNKQQALLEFLKSARHVSTIAQWIIRIDRSQRASADTVAVIRNGWLCLRSRSPRRSH